MSKKKTSKITDLSAEKTEPVCVTAAGDDLGYFSMVGTNKASQSEKLIQKK